MIEALQKTFQVLWLDVRHSVCADEERSSTRTFEKILISTSQMHQVSLVTQTVGCCWLQQTSHSPAAKLFVSAEPNSSLSKQTNKQKSSPVVANPCLLKEGTTHYKIISLIISQIPSPQIKVSRAPVIWWFQRLSCQISLRCEVCQIVILLFLSCSEDDWGCPSLKTFTLNMFNHQTTNQKWWLWIYLRW